MPHQSSLKTSLTTIDVRVARDETCRFSHVARRAGSCSIEEMGVMRGRVWFLMNVGNFSMRARLFMPDNWLVFDFSPAYRWRRFKGFPARLRPAPCLFTWSLEHEEVNIRDGGQTCQHTSLAVSYQRSPTIASLLHSTHHFSPTLASIRHHRKNSKDISLRQMLMTRALNRENKLMFRHCKSLLGR